MKIDVLDHGYVRLVDVLGDDLSVVNAARVSFDKESLEFSERDEKLLKFLWSRKESAPFRHAALTFECYAPLMVCRQWWKYVVASAHLDDQIGWNESSRRYVTEEPIFYVPRGNQWRSAPENKKQGSGENLPAYSPDPTNREFLGYGNIWEERLNAFNNEGIRLYEDAIEAGVAPEQARLFLPAYGMYVRWRWTISLAGILHFLDERVEHKAQFEIQQFAIAVQDLTRSKFPATLKVVEGLRDKS